MVQRAHVGRLENDSHPVSTLLFSSHKSVEVAVNNTYLMQLV